MALVKVAVKNVGHFGAVDALRKIRYSTRAQLGEDAPGGGGPCRLERDDKVSMVAVVT